MTEERKKFLVSVSKEELAIRYAIKHQQDVISNCKEDLTNPWLFSAPANILKLQIADTKAIIKALKKQLPAPKIPLELNEVVFPRTCSVCKYPLAEYSYCPCCGQRLR